MKSTPGEIGFLKHKTWLSVAWCKPAAVWLYRPGCRFGRHGLRSERRPCTVQPLKWDTPNRSSVEFKGGDECRKRGINFSIKKDRFAWQYSSVCVLTDCVGKQFRQKQEYNKRVLKFTYISNIYCILCYIKIL